MSALHTCTNKIKLNTGAELDQIALGTWKSTEEEGYNAVVMALKNGYRHVDSAAVYGNERPVGRAIKDSGIPRNEIFLTTKLWGTEHYHPDVALDSSLERLGTEYVDLFLIHWPVALRPAPERKGDDLLYIPLKEDGNRDLDLDWSFVKTWEKLQDLPKEKTRAVGVSNFSINNLKALQASPGFKFLPAVNQVELNPYNPQFELVEYCQSKGIQVEAYSPLGSDGSPILKDDVIIKIAEKHNVSPGHIVISWIVSRGVIVLPKSTKESRIISNREVLTLDQEDIDAINDLHKTKGKRFVTPNWAPFPVFE